VKLQVAQVQQAVWQQLEQQADQALFEQQSALLLSWEPVEQPAPELEVALGQEVFGLAPALEQQPATAKQAGRALFEQQPALLLSWEIVEQLVLEPEVALGREA
jgi:hypothetical protein